LADPVTWFIVSTIIQVGISYLFPAEGPRMRDLRVSASTYGAVIPEIWGTCRVGGNLIWSAGIREVKQKKRAGKGGGYYNDYSYFVDCAFAFAKGPVVGVRKLWADGKVIYNGGLHSYSIALLCGGSAAIYVGSEEQLPDPTMEAAEGAGNVPAYRDLFYLVFNDLPLKDFGGRVPQMAAEVYATSSTVAITPIFFEKNNEDDDPVYIPDSDWQQLLVDPIRSLRYAAGTRYNYDVSDGFGFEQGLIIYELTTGTVTQFIPDHQMTTLDLGATTTDSDGLSHRAGYFRPLALTYMGDMIVETSALNEGDTAGVKLARVDSITAQAVATVGEELDIADYVEPVYPAEVDASASLILKSFGPYTGSVCANDYSGIEYYLHISDGFDGASHPEGDHKPLRWYIVRTSDMTVAAKGFVPNSQPYTYFHVAQRYQQLVSPTWYVMIGRSDFDETGDHTINNLDLYRVDLDGWNRQTFLFNPPEGEATDSDPHNYRVIQCHWDFGDNGVVVFWKNGGRTFISKWMEEGNYWDWETEITELGAVGGDSSPPSYIGIYDNRVVFATTNNVLHYLDSLTGEFVVETSEPCRNVTVDPDDIGDYEDASVLFDGYGGFPLEPSIGTETMWIEPTLKIYVGVNGGQREGAFSTAALINTIGDDGNPLSSVGNIVERLLRRAGLKRRDFDLTVLYSIQIYGYGFAANADVRSILDDLRRLYQFDLRESDGRITACLRGNEDPRLTIPQALLGGESYWRETRIQEAELPELVELTYMNYQRAFENSTARSKRIVNPHPTMFSRQRQVFQCNAVMEAVEAKQRVQKLLYSQWLERTKHETSLPWAFLTLDPGDVVEVAMDDGRTYLERLHRLELGSDLSIETECYGQDSGAYESNIVESDGGDGGDYDGETPIAKPAYPLILNTPLLRDADDMGGTVSTYYTSVLNSVNGTFNGAGLFRSTNGLDFTNIDSYTQDAEWGVVVGKLEEPSSIWAPDETTVLTIRPLVPWFELETITEEDLLSGQNAAMVGNELIQFRDAVENADGTWNVSYILRGRRGTDYAVGTHANAERFVTLSTSWITAQTETTDVIGQNRYFKAVGSGLSVLEQQSHMITYYPRDLMPYAVTNITRELSGSDIVIEWFRRSRLGGGWLDYVEDTPLHETSEEYEIYILSSAFDGDLSLPTAPSPYIRRLTATTNTVTYTLAQQAADDFSYATDTLHLVIYQLSGVVGRGFPAPRSITPTDIE